MTRVSAGMPEWLDDNVASLLAEPTSNIAAALAAAVEEQIGQNPDAPISATPPVPDKTELPRGGTTGQLLAKKSTADGDVGWVNPPAPSTGGSGGNILVLNATQPVPAGTPAGTVIVRTGGTYVPPVTTDPDPEPEPEPQPEPEEPVYPQVVAETAVTAKLNAGMNLTIAKPSGVATGDLLIAVLHNQTGTNGVLTPPQGWEVLSVPFTGESRFLAILGFRVTDAAALPTGWTFNYNQSGRMVGGIFRVTGAATSGAIKAGASELASLTTATAKIPAFEMSGRGLVIAMGTTQATVAAGWPLPASYSAAQSVKVLELGNDEANKATATNSTLSVFAVPAPAGTFAESTITWSLATSNRAGLAVGVRG